VTQLGKQEPRYRFILNPHDDIRFTTCPNCQNKTRQRKLPLVIFVEPTHWIALNKTCRYCPDCDLLIAHQDNLEHLPATLFASHSPKDIGNDYLVVGTLDRPKWRQGVKEPLQSPDMIENLHDFKETWGVEVDPGGWRPTE
jgi:hypothetical protein